MNLDIPFVYEAKIRKPGKKNVKSYFLLARESFDIQEDRSRCLPRAAHLNQERQFYNKNNTRETITSSFDYYISDRGLITRFFSTDRNWGKAREQSWIENLVLSLDHCANLSLGQNNNAYYVDNPFSTTQDIWLRSNNIENELLIPEGSEWVESNREVIKAKLQKFLADAKIHGGELYLPSKGPCWKVNTTWDSEQGGMSIILQAEREYSHFITNKEVFSANRLEEAQAYAKKQSEKLGNEGYKIKGKITVDHAGYFDTPEPSAIILSSIRHFIKLVSSHVGNMKPTAIRSFAEMVENLGLVEEQAAPSDLSVDNLRDSAIAFCALHQEHLGKRGKLGKNHPLKEIVEQKMQGYKQDREGVVSMDLQDILDTEEAFKP